MIYHGSRFRDVLFGTSLDDSLYGYDGDDALYGGGGNDHLWGGPGADWLDGGAGNDTAHYEDAKDGVGVYVRLDTGAGYTGIAAGDTLIGIEHLSGTSYNDILVGDGGINNIWGNDGDDLIFGLDGADTLYGGGGNDHIWGGGELDYIYGGDGYDYVHYDSATTGVDVRLDEPPPGFVLAPGGGWSGDEAYYDQLWSIEGIVGSQFDDHLVGSDPAPGTNPNNVLFGLGGDDWLLGKGGDDILVGGEGADYLDGGAGFDYAQYDESPSGVWVSLEAGFGYTGTALHDRLVDIEGLVGSNFDDTLTGNAVGNVLLGGMGNDTLEGRAGGDILFGAKDNDVLDGGEGADYLDGGDGFDIARYEGAVSGVQVSLATGRGTLGEALDDVLVSIEGLVGSNYGDTLIGDGTSNMLRGGLGADSLTGGSGDDSFVFERNDLLAGNDSILDFGTILGNSDTLVFHGLTAADIALTSDPAGTRVSVLDPAFGGGILVFGITPTELSGHLLFA